MPELKATESNHNVIPLEQIQPNPFNPNRMSEEQFQEYVEEVRRLGRLPKPIVIRPVKDEGDEYEIIDGEHAWRAAKEVGLKEVLCGIDAIDNFEAMR